MDSLAPYLAPRTSSATRALVAALVALMAVPALAQQNEPQKRRRHLPGGAAAPFHALPDNALPFVNPTQPNALSLPLAPQTTLGERTPVLMEARLAAGQPLLKNGLHWRVFNDKPEPTGVFALVAESQDASAMLSLRPGSYIATITHGTLTQSRRLIVGTETKREELVLNAGALRVTGQVAGKPLNAQRLSIDIYQGSLIDNGEQKLALRQVHPGDLVMLPEGTYNIVSNFGDANATIRADVRVRAGKLTDATLNHRAATINLRLVAPQDRATVSNTSWSVLTPGGDVIKESIGAFPSIVLAEGEYLALARHDGRIFNHKFTVEAGQDQDIAVEAR